MDADDLRKIITSQNAEKMRGVRNNVTRRIVRVIEEPVFMLRRLVFFVGKKRCVSTILSLNLKLEKKFALRYYLNEMMKTLRLEEKPQLKRVKAQPSYSRVVTAEQDHEQEEAEEAKEEEKMEVDESYEDLEQAFARAVNIQGSEQDEINRYNRSKDPTSEDIPYSMNDPSTADKLESLLSDLIERELSSNCAIKEEEEDEDD